MKRNSLLQELTKAIENGQLPYENEIPKEDMQIINSFCRLVQDKRSIESTDSINAYGQPKKGAKFIPSKVCVHCERNVVSVFHKGHHCRACGFLFCSKCTKARQVLPHVFGYGEQPVRLCVKCVEWFQYTLDQFFEDALSGKCTRSTNELGASSNGSTLAAMANLPGVDLTTDFTRADAELPNSNLLMERVSHGFRIGAISSGSKDSIRDLIQCGNKEEAKIELDSVFAEMSDDDDERDSVDSTTLDEQSDVDAIDVEAFHEPIETDCEKSKGIHENLALFTAGNVLSDEEENLPKTRASSRSVSLDAAHLMSYMNVKPSDQSKLVQVAEEDESIKETKDDTSLSLPYQGRSSMNVLYPGTILHFAVSRISNTDTFRKTFGLGKKSWSQDRYTLEFSKIYGMIQAKGVFRHRHLTFQCDMVQNLKDSSYGADVLDIVIATGQSMEVLTFQFANSLQKDEFRTALENFRTAKNRKSDSKLSNIPPMHATSQTMHNGRLKSLDPDEINEADDDFGTLTIQFLNGEKEVNGTAWPAVLYLGPNGTTDFEAWGRVRGVVSITNYRLIFIPYENDNIPVSQRVSYIPLFAILKAYRDVIKKTSSRDASTGGLVITCKDFRTMRIELDGPFTVSEDRTQSLRLLILAMSQSVQTRKSLRDAKINSSSGAFAYDYNIFAEPDTDGWRIYNELDEIQRQGLRYTDDIQGTGKQQIKLLHNNKGIICQSYPEYLPVPEIFSDKDYASISAFRAKNRLPVITWYHAKHGCVLVRSGQPLLGNLLTGSGSELDQKLLDFYRLFPEVVRSNGQVPVSSRPLYIFDARKVKASAGNRIMGKGGVESSQDYRNTIICHLNISNIYRMQASYSALMKLVLPGGYADKSWQNSLEATRWLDHIRLTLSGALKIARALEVEKASVLVHCSDGWDRTSQLTALAQIMIDSHYRTIRGFALLVEKDWCAYGHKFAERVGGDFGQPTHGAKWSPVFLQFLDATLQMSRQFPTAFEFNEEFLLHIANALTSGLYGTFLYNSVVERNAYEAHKITTSVWTPVLQDVERFQNATYTKSIEPIWPWTDSPMIRLWNQYFFQWHPKNPQCRWMSTSNPQRKATALPISARSASKGTSHTIVLGSVPTPVPSTRRSGKFFW